MSDVVSSEGLKDNGFPTKVFGLVPYMQISPVSPNLLIISCMVDDDISKAVCLLFVGKRNVVFHNLFLHFFTEQSLCPALLLRDSCKLFYKADSLPLLPSPQLILLCFLCSIVNTILALIVSYCSKCYIKEIIV